MLGCAPGCPSTSGAGSAPLGTSQARSASGSATVAESPMRIASGASACTRVSASDSSTPRFEVTSECSSSRITVRSPFSRCAACGSATSSDTCSGVVIRMSGGFWRCRRRFECGVSPVRVSTVTGSPISATGASRLRAMSTASAFSGEM